MTALDDLALSPADQKRMEKEAEALEARNELQRDIEIILGRKALKARQMDVAADWLRGFKVIGDEE